MSNPRTYDAMLEAAFQAGADFAGRSHFTAHDPHAREVAYAAWRDSFLPGPECPRCGHDNNADPSWVATDDGWDHSIIQHAPLDLRLGEPVRDANNVTFRATLHTRFVRCSIVNRDKETSQ